MKGTVHHWKHELAVCKCGTQFMRTVWKGTIRTLCDRCKSNRDYQLKMRRNRDKKKS